MNRNALLGVILLVVTAVVGVVLLGPGENPPPIDPLDPSQPGIEEPGTRDPAEVNPGGRRTALEPTLDEAPEADPDAVVGQVFGPDGAPMDRARVVFAHKQFGGARLGWTLQTILLAGTGADAQGRFRLPIEDGKRQDLAVVAVAPGTTPTRVEEVSAGDRILIRLKPQLMQPGRVLAPDGRPAAGVPVELFDPSGETDGLPAVETTDENGAFTLRSPGPGTYSLRVRSAVGQRYLNADFEVLETPEPIEIRLKGELSISLTAMDVGGQPIPGAELTMRLSKASLPLRARADEDGKIQVAGLVPGNWQAELAAEGFAPIRERVVYEGVRMDLDWTLEKFASLQVTVVNGKDRPLPGTRLRVLPDPKRMVALQDAPLAIADDAGIAVFEELEPGRYVLTPESRPGHNPTQLFETGIEGEVREEDFAQLIVLAGGQPGQTRLVLRRHGFLTLMVQQNGQAVVGARGSLTRGIVPRQETWDALDLSDLEGRLEFPSVWAGEYEVEVQGAPDQLVLRQPFKVGRGLSKETINLPTGVLRGTIEGPQGPRAGARVSIQTPGSDWRVYATSGSDGRFEIGGFPATSFAMRVEAPGQSSWEREDLQHDGKVLDLGPVRLGVAYDLQGRIDNVPEGDLLFGPVLTLFNARGESVATKSLEGDGTFSFRNLTAGRYSLRVLQSGQTLLEESIELPSNEGDLVLRLP